VSAESNGLGSTGESLLELSQGDLVLDAPPPSGDEAGPLGGRLADRTQALDAVLTDLRGDARDREQQLEALLFSTHVPLTAGEIAKALVRSVEDVTAALARLERALADRSTAVAMFVREKGGEKAFILDLKAAYRKDAAAVAPPMLKQAVTETLALIAINQPLSQARLVRERGSTVYEHVKELMTRGLIQRQRKGRNYFLRTTDAFAAEFGLDNDPELIRRALARAAGVERAPEVVGSPRVHLGVDEGQEAVDPQALVTEALSCVPPEVVAPPEPAVEAVEEITAAPVEVLEVEAHDEPPSRDDDEDEDCIVSGGEPPTATVVEPPIAVAKLEEVAPVSKPETIEQTREIETTPSEPPPARITQLLDLFQEQSTTDDW
jgi:segregation and condensation protein B